MKAFLYFNLRFCPSEATHLDSRRWSHQIQGHSSIPFLILAQPLVTKSFWICSAVEQQACCKSYKCQHAGCFTVQSVQWCAMYFGVTVTVFQSSSSCSLNWNTNSNPSLGVAFQWGAIRELAFDTGFIGRQYLLLDVGPHCWPSRWQRPRKWFENLGTLGRGLWEGHGCLWLWHEISALSKSPSLNTRRQTTFADFS